MRLVSLIIVVMVAFAANSLLNRAALASGAMGPSSFAALRLISGALCLAIMLRARGGGVDWQLRCRRGFLLMSIVRTLPASSSAIAM